MGQKEPPSPQHGSPLYMIGRDSRGRWVVQDRTGLHGGYFINRAEALKFALFENGRRPQAVVMVPGIFELSINGRPALETARNTPHLHRAAAA